MSTATAPAQATRGAMCDRKCKCCGKAFSARVADVKRGWAQFCSKSCKAMKQEKSTGQHRNRINNGISDALVINAMRPEDREAYFAHLADLDHEAAMYEAFSSHGQDEGW